MPARYICILIRSGFPEQDFWSPVCFQNRPLHSIYYNGPIDSSSISIQTIPERFQIHIYHYFPMSDFISLLVHQILLYGSPR